MEDVGTGQEGGVSVMAGRTGFCWEARATQCRQADGAVPYTSLDHLLEIYTQHRLLQRQTSPPPRYYKELLTKSVSHYPGDNMFI